MNVLALEPFYGGSHKNFLKGLVSHSAHEILAVTMTDRFWKWRMQGGAVTLARKALEAVDNGFHPDVILATSMVNVPAFLALTRSVFSNTPVVYYLHENQITYPLPEDIKRDYTYGYINYLSCLASDRVVFNSHFHFQEFTDALPELLRIFPDYTHLQRAQEIREKSSVLHLGLDLGALDAHSGDYSGHDWGPGMPPPIVLWNHRWEYDKNPAGFFRLMNRLDDAGCNFRLILAGEHFNVQPAEFDRAFERYADRVLHYGYAEDLDEYAQLLHRADIVVSTALHEFFGISIMEAIYCGCHPMLPEKLTYPELIPDNLHSPLLHAPCLYKDDDDLFNQMRKILNGEERPLPVSTLKGVCKHLDWDQHVDNFDALFEEVAGSR